MGWTNEGLTMESRLMRRTTLGAAVGVAVRAAGVALAAVAVMVALPGGAYASSAFEGRLADGTASATCTVSGANKCAMFYNNTLDITILNDWNIGRGFWSATAAPGSAQARAESAGALQTDFSGWFLPTGDGSQAPGALNQYRSIWNEVGGTFGGLQAQFDGVFSPTYYWSGTEYAPDPSKAWYFRTFDGDQNFGSHYSTYQGNALYAVAVRPGDVAAVPEPQAYALMLMGMGAVLLAVRRRPH
jgi:hypothetical protein